MEIPVIGLGGVETVEDVLEYLSAGASAVQVGTASFARPNATERLVVGITSVLFKAKARNIKEIVKEFEAEKG